jgi:hypothetical protein
MACISLGLNEKKATSDPDINADEAMSTIKSKIGRITSTGNENNACPKNIINARGGSVSNVVILVKK